MNTKHTDPYQDQPCFCGKKSNFEVKIAKTSEHIFTRQQVCSFAHAIEWLANLEQEQTK